jgi:AMP phosphorylase
LARIAGAPLDKLAGVFLHKHLNEKIKKGNPLLTIYSESKSELEHAVEYFKKEKPLKLK